MSGGEMATAPLISIVIPAYNAVAHLEECVRSIANQGLSNCQVVLIDDGSTDATGALCDSLAHEFAGVFALHTENQGPAAARNTGFAHAGGEWIWFVDADDLVSRDALDVLSELVSTAEADLVAFNFEPFDDSGVLPMSVLGIEVAHVEGATDAQVLERMLFEGRRGHYLYSYLFRADRLREFARQGKLFDDDIWLFEDAAFLHGYLRSVNNVAWIDRPLYRYRQTENSLLHHCDARKAASGIKAVDTIAQLGIDPELEGARQQMLVRFLLSIDTLAGGTAEAAEVHNHVRMALGKSLAGRGAGALPLKLRIKCFLVRIGVYQAARKALSRMGITRAWEEA